jgi:ubiquinone/menaquinone biosynthesis C-methylase UbiE
VAVPVNPAPIMAVAFGFWQSKTLLSAVELDLFTELGEGSLAAAEIAQRLKLAAQVVPDFLDALVALGLLSRDGNGLDARYRNTGVTRVFLDRRSPQYLGAALELANARLYRYWGGLTDALRTGRPQSEARDPQASLFDPLYSDPADMESFGQAMAVLSAGHFAALAESFDFGCHQSVCDVGGATGQLAIALATRHPHLRCTTLDLPAIESLARHNVERSGVGDRVKVVSADFFAGPLPAADVITMSSVLHNWHLPRKLQLIGAAHAALPPGGAFIVIENMIDDERRVNASALLSSLNMLIETGEGFEFTGTEFRRWCAEAGFSRVEVRPLSGTAAAGIAYK